MRRFLILFSIILVSCTPMVELDYSTDSALEELVVDYPNSFIEWGNLFLQEETSYFVYVFAYDCYYCKETKKNIISFAQNLEYKVYFVEYKKHIPIGNNVESTIGAKQIEDVFIRGTPTLMFFSNNELLLNVAGKSEVNELINLYSQN